MNARMHAAGECPYGDMSLGSVTLTSDHYGKCYCGNGELLDVVAVDGLTYTVCSTELV